MEYKRLSFQFPSVLENSYCKYSFCKTQKSRRKTRKNKKLNPVNLVKRTSPLLPENQASTFAETEYYFERGLRKVKPYFFTHNSFTKKRWIGQSPLEILAKEYTIYGQVWNVKKIFFKSLTKEQIKQMIEKERFMINMKPLTADQMESYRLKDGDLFSSKVHRHEPPITTQKPKIIFEDEKFFIIDKPSSYPIHPVTQVWSSESLSEFQNWL